MILASHPLMLLQHYGLPVIVALNRFGSDTEREFEMIRKHLGEQSSYVARWRRTR
jgi:formyltetrahydrofolate synthetase